VKSIFILFLFLIPTVSFAQSAVLSNGNLYLTVTPTSSTTMGTAIAYTSEGTTTDGQDFHYGGYGAGWENYDPYVAYPAFATGSYSIMVDIPVDYFTCIDAFGTGGLSDYQTVVECQGLGYDGFVASYTVDTNLGLWENLVDLNPPATPEPEMDLTPSYATGTIADTKDLSFIVFLNLLVFIIGFILSLWIVRIFLR